MNSIIKHLKIALLIGIVVFVVMKAISFSLGESIMLGRVLLTQFLYFMLYAVVLYTANALAHLYVSKKFTKDNVGSKQLIFGLLFGVLATLLAIFLLRIIEDVCIEGLSLALFLEKERLVNYLIPFIISTIVTLGILVFNFFKISQDKKVKQQKIIAGTANAKYESLKNQLDPHFLFNSLNVLTSLIEEDAIKAQRFTTALSKVYRYVLEQKNKDVVSLLEEINFAKTYMSLLQMRFENAVSIALPDIKNIEDIKIVPLALQILLENCIKHNIVTEEQPLKITITIQENELIVSNNLQQKTVVQKSSGIGLKNIYERYLILSNKTITINQTANTYSVHLPLLTKQISIMEQSQSSKNERYYAAKKRVDNLKGFYGNILAYCIVIPFLAILNYKTSWHAHKWFVYPMLGWGIGIVFHAFEVFGRSKYFGKSWEDRKIREFMEEEEQQSNKWN